MKSYISNAADAIFKAPEEYQNLLVIQKRRRRLTERETRPPGMVGTSLRLRCFPNKVHPAEAYRVHGNAETEVRFVEQRELTKR
ncbi:MAG: hypothetical protein WD468_11660, partial [Pirellulales bacterium]